MSGDESGEKRHLDGYTLPCYTKDALVRGSPIHEGLVYSSHNWHIRSAGAMTQQRRGQ